MALTLGNTASQLETGGSGVSFSFSNNGNLLLVFIGLNGGYSAPSATYNGQSLSQASTWRNDALVSSGWFYLNNAPQGSYTLATSHPSTYGACGVVSVSGAHGTSPLGGSGSGAANANSISASLTSQATTSLILQGVYDNFGGTVSSYGTNQTETINQRSITNCGICVSKKTGTNSSTSLTTNFSNITNLGTSVIEILQASSVPSGMLLMF